MNFKGKKLLPGLRTMKTALSIVICIISADFFSNLTGLNFVAFYGCITAVFTLQTTQENTRIRGFNRALGTIIGSFVAVIFLVIFSVTDSYVIKILLIFIGSCVTIHLCYLFSLYDGVMIACIMFLASITVADSNYMGYVVIRIIETFYGVFVAIIINNYLLPYKKGVLK
jgi:uncharacterized membrane protein YgaE (UPF0421/DUF939 family)